jgi:N utilization substance protein B
VSLATERRAARERALGLLYEAEAKGLDGAAVLAGLPVPADDYAASLVRAVDEHRERIDELLGRYAEGWTLDRMPVVDRTALRIGAYELLYLDDVPAPVAVSEAVALVRNLSTDDSPAFVNGVLGSMLRDRDSLIG